jgi:hypothetical protein
MFRQGQLKLDLAFNGSLFRYLLEVGNGISIEVGELIKVANPFHRSVGVLPVDSLGLAKKEQNPAGFLLG